MAVRHRRVKDEQLLVVLRLVLLAHVAILLVLSRPELDLRLEHRRGGVPVVRRLVVLIRDLVLKILARAAAGGLYGHLGQLDLLLRLRQLIGQVHPRDGEPLVVALALAGDRRLERDAVLLVICAAGDA